MLCSTALLGRGIDPPLCRTMLARCLLLHAMLCTYGLHAGHCLSSFLLVKQMEVIFKNRSLLAYCLVWKQKKKPYNTHIVCSFCSVAALNDQCCRLPNPLPRCNAFGFSKNDRPSSYKPICSSKRLSSSSRRESFGMKSPSQRIRLSLMSTTWMSFGASILLTSSRSSAHQISNCS